MQLQLGSHDLFSANANTVCVQLAGGSGRPSSIHASTVPVIEKHYLNQTRGFLSWALTLDHKRIGIMYLVGILACFALGGVMALLVRTELWAPGRTITDPNTYNMWFTVHGAVMVFLVIIPGIPAALGNFALPLLLGAKDVAFPP